MTKLPKISEELRAQILEAFPDTGQRFESLAELLSAKAALGPIQKLWAKKLLNIPPRHAKAGWIHNIDPVYLSYPAYCAFVPVMLLSGRLGFGLGPGATSLCIDLPAFARRGEDWSAWEDRWREGLVQYCNQTQIEALAAYVKSYLEAYPTPETCPGDHRNCIEFWERASQKS